MTPGSESATYSWIEFSRLGWIKICGWPSAKNWSEIFLWASMQCVPVFMRNLSKLEGWDKKRGGLKIWVDPETSQWPMFKRIGGLGRLKTGIIEMGGVKLSDWGVFTRQGWSEGRSEGRNQSTVCLSSNRLTGPTIGDAPPDDTSPTLHIVLRKHHLALCIVHCALCITHQTTMCTRAQCNF